jgi:hypothetical protein
MTDIDLQDKQFIETLKAEREIARVIHLAARACDRKDLEVQKSCYHEDATDNHGIFSGTVDGFFEWAEKHHENFDVFMHQMGTPYIQIDGTTAFAETYCIAIQRLKTHSLYSLEAAPLVMHGCRFLDEFEQRDGKWKIAKRNLVFEWSRTDWSAAGNVPGGDSSNSINVGLRSKEDMLYGFGDGVLMKSLP